MSSFRFAPLAAVLVSSLLAGSRAQAQAGSTLPATLPTSATAPLVGASTPADRAGARRHRAQVTCTGGQLQVRADNSSLNGILHSVAQCTGMKITGGVADQRVYGNYGPAMPATVLATLLDGTGTNILLRETASDQPAELILTPRMGGPTPPSPGPADEDEADEMPPQSAPNPGGGAGTYRGGRANTTGSAQTSSSAFTGAVSGPVSIPQPINNVMGSPNSVSPNAATYPTTNSVPLDSLPTPSTTPNQAGIVSAPNPPAAGSDTAALLNGRTANMPGNTTITDQPTSQSPALDTLSSQPDAASTTGANGAASPGQNLTPQQVYEQLQKLRQQQQSQDGSTPQPQTQSPTSPQP